MSLLKVDFAELYQRHLCRHSQFGINVLHILALAGIYLGLLAILHWLLGWWVLPAIAVPYLGLLAFNLPGRVFAVLAAAVATLFAAHWLVTVELLLPLARSSPVPALPLLVGLPLVYVCYKVQLWSHKVYPLERDMTEFNRKYPKGLKLFVLLSLYELAILLNYLTFDRASWASGAGPVPGHPPASA